MHMMRGPKLTMGRGTCFAMVLLVCFGWLCSSLIADDANDDGQPPASLAPPHDIVVKDQPHDEGRTLIVRWSLSPDDTPADLERQRVKAYRIERARAGTNEFEEVAVQPSPLREFKDDKVKWWHAYLYRVTAIGVDDTESEAIVIDQPVSPAVSLFDIRTGWFLLITAFVSFWIIWFIYMAKRGADLKIRKIAGLEAVDEAVKRLQTLAAFLAIRLGDEYERRWQDRYDPLVTNRRLIARCRLAAGRVQDCTLIKGSGVPELDRRLVSWIRNQAARGSALGGLPVPDGEQVLVLPLPAP